MEENEQTYKIMNNIYEDLSKIKMLIDLIKNEVQSADYELYILEQKIKKETPADRQS